ncbi:MAG: 2-C-methyl-D-erythritol 2,4-cyclodiphosphate synthase [Chlamydiae bacterium]|nr:2-C-methyl-D-erythritol 2,4-cyclodiphosphate synthase [Chlamydiota bacterium]
MIKTGIGQDSHRFESTESSKPCMLGGVIFKDVPGFHANSDGDVIYHAICNAISSITGVLVLGGLADELCLKDGITDSSTYLQSAKETLKNHKIHHVSLSIEAKKPKIKERLDEIKRNIAKILEVEPHQVGLTATSGEGLTDFGCGVGVQCLCIITVSDESN